jgi:hypothetical protein
MHGDLTWPAYRSVIARSRLLHEYGVTTMSVHTQAAARPRGHSLRMIAQRRNLGVMGRGDMLLTDGVARHDGHVEEAASGGK